MSFIKYYHLKWCNGTTVQKNVQKFFCFSEHYCYKGLMHVCVFKIFPLMANWQLVIKYTIDLISATITVMGKRLINKFKIVLHLQSAFSSLTKLGTLGARITLLEPKIETFFTWTFQSISLMLQHLDLDFVSPTNKKPILLN